MTDAVAATTTTKAADATVSASADTAASAASPSFVSVPDPAAAAAAAADPAKAAAPARPDGIPDDLWDATTGLKVADVAARLKETADAKAAADAAKGALPKSSEEYLPTLPASLKLPDGVKVDVNDPRFKAAQKLAFDSGMSQEKFTELLGIEAQGAVAKGESIKRAITARDAALGPNGPARVDALKSFFTATSAPPEMANVLFTAPIVTYLEKLQTTLGSQGVASLTRVTSSDAPKPGTIPGYADMSFSQKMAARENLKAAGGGRS